MRKAFYDGLPVYADEGSIEETTYLHVHIKGAEYPNRQFTWVEEPNFLEAYHTYQGDKRTEKTIVVNFRHMSQRVPLSEVEFYPKEET